MEVLSDFSVEQYPLLHILKNSKVMKTPPVSNTFKTPDGAFVRKEEYANLTKKERSNAYVKTYYSRGGKIYYCIRNRCKKYGFTKDKFTGCKTMKEVDNRVIELLKDAGYPETIIKALVNHRKRKCKYSYDGETTSSTDASTDEE